ncbi:MAG: SDR family oxidoreductase [Parvibaculum sp.]|uniref:SDR family oxidoreductase n=1 Tax=Parvibaculum sp. TaxID=2024848 RepID=UPI003C73BD8B
MKNIVVTGASTGIGWATVKVLTEAGFHVFGSVRKQADADRLKQTFGDKVTPLIFDVTDAAGAKRAADEVRGKLNGEKLFGLVNNAGIAVSGPMLEIDIDEFRNQMEVNVTGPVIVTQAFGPLLGVDKSLKGAPGRIVNISSVAGKNSAPFLGPYSASKHALEAISEALRRELQLFGIDVIIIGPGAVATPIWDKAEQMDITPYKASPYLPMLERIQDYMVKNGRAQGYPPERIARQVLKALTLKKPKTRYAVVSGRLMNWTIPGLLPRRFVDRLIGKRLGLLP